MRVRFSHDIFGLQQVGGISRYAVELHRALLRGGVESEILAGFHVNEYLDGCPCVRGIRSRRRRLRRVLRRGNELWNLLRGRCTVFHRTFHSSRRRPSCDVRATTVYDMIPEIFPDPTDHRANGSRDKRIDCETADVICAISEVTRQDLHRLWGIPLDRIRVTHLGVARTEPSAVDWISRLGPFIVHVGRRWGYKNFIGLLPSVARVLPKRGVRLACFVGGGPPTEEESRAIAGLDLEDRIAFVSGSDADLAACYAQALGHVTASLYEGFGLTPLEAMMHGCPVACSNRGALPETAGQAALLFDPDDVPALDDALRWLLRGREANQLHVQAGIRRCEQFSWDATARTTLEAYAHALQHSALRS